MNAVEPPEISSGIRADMTSSVEWMPHRVAGDTLSFVKLSRADHRRLTFITDDYIGGAAPRRLLSVGDLASHRGGLQANRCHFLFHSAFCCSTLLARALDVEGNVMTLKEPAALLDLAEAMPARDMTANFRKTIAIVLNLLAQPFDRGEAVVIKPTNVANPLIDCLLALRPDAKAICLYSPLPDFLRSVAQKGLWGRIWARRASRSLSRFPEFDPGYSPAECWDHSDLQVAALTWLQQQAHFARLVRSQPRGRIATLDSKMLLSDPRRTMAEINAMRSISARDCDIATTAESERPMTGLL